MMGRFLRRGFSRPPSLVPSLSPCLPPFLFPALPASLPLSLPLYGHTRLFTPSLPPAFPLVRLAKPAVDDRRRHDGRRHLHRRGGPLQPLHGRSPPFLPPALLPSRPPYLPFPPSRTARVLLILPFPSSGCPGFEFPS